MNSEILVTILITNIGAMLASYVSIKTQITELKTLVGVLGKEVDLLRCKNEHSSNKQRGIQC